MGIYVRAMRYPEHTPGAQRAISAGKHTGLDGFACRVALDSRDRLIGFGLRLHDTARVSGGTTWCAAP